MKKREKTETINIKNVTEVISIESTSIKRMIIEYYEKFYAKYLIM